MSASWNAVSLLGLGRIAHGSMPFLGDSAINHMGAFIHLLETQLQPCLSSRYTAEPVEPPGARVSTLNINSIHGGQVEQIFSLDALSRSTGDLPAPVVSHSYRAVLGPAVHCRRKPGSGES